ARRDARSVVDLDGVRSPIAAQMRRALRDYHLRAEFLGLTERARRKLLSRDAGREAEVIFDPHAGAGLPARRIRFDHQHVETFRCRVNGSAETCGTSADDHHIANVALVDVNRLIEADAIRDLRI